MGLYLDLQQSEITDRFLSISAVVAQGPTNAVLETVRSTYHLPGLAAARHRDNETKTNVRVVGVRKQGNDTPITPDDVFHLGSLTKAMTATLVAILINDPKNNLTWDTTIPEAFPAILNLAPGYHRATIAMLGSHFAGINDTKLVESDLETWLALRNETVTPITGRGLVAKKALAAPPSTVPGSRFSYSNIGYMILGHLIDTHVCGGWEAYIQRRLWRPLGMTGCGFGPTPQRTPESVDNPWPHRPGDPEPIPVIPDRFSDNPPAVGPAGTVHCDIPSYSKFLGLHLRASLGQDSPILKAAAFARLHTPFVGNTTTNASTEISYTPGGWILQGPDPRVNGSYLVHDGSNTLNYAYAVVAPGAGEAYFTATNVGGEVGAGTGLNEVLIGFFDHTLGF